jgi:homoserine O-acetyltransferase
LLHHGEKLQQRFQLASYKMMNQLLKTIDITRNRSSFENTIKTVEAEIHSHQFGFVFLQVKTKPL